MQNQNELGKDVSTVGDIVADGLVQHVDLARFIPKQQKVYLSFSQILQICALTMVVFLGYSLYGNWQRVVISKQIANLQFQSNELVEKMSSGRLKKIQESSNNEGIYAILQAERAKNGLGFSRYFEALADACPNGVWLTAIEIKKRSNAVILSGKAYRANSVMQLVDNLNRNALFSSDPFFIAKIVKDKDQTTTKDKDQTMINQSTKPPVIYSFTLRTPVPVVMEPKT